MPKKLKNEQINPKITNKMSNKQIIIIKMNQKTELKRP
jgi:hypothetical protein